jgi:hypothetical protein
VVRRREGCEAVRRGARACQRDTVRSQDADSGCLTAFLPLRRCWKNDLDDYGNPQFHSSGSGCSSAIPISLVPGPAAEGGYYVIAEPRVPELFTAIAWAAAACCTRRSRAPHVVAFLCVWCGGRR